MKILPELGPLPPKSSLLVTRTSTDVFSSVEVVSSKGAGKKLSVKSFSRLPSVSFPSSDKSPVSSAP